MTEKKNIDYSASAVNLTNSLDVCALLQTLQIEQMTLVSLRKESDDLVPQHLKDFIIKSTKKIEEIEKAIRQAIDLFGSYQDVENGMYAIKQRRESISYKPELVRQYAPSKVASFVLIESVDSKALDALVKAGQLTPEQARQCGEAKESFAYIVKV